MTVGFYFIFYRFPTALENLHDGGVSFLDERLVPFPHLVSRTTIPTTIQPP